MSKHLEEITRCDVCGETPDGDRVDNVSHLSCGHDICNHHRLPMLPGQGNAYGHSTCPICNPSRVKDSWKQRYSVFE